SSQLAQNPAFVRFDPQGVLWVADRANGLVKVHGSQEENFFPSGPPTDDTWKVTFAGDKLIGVAGGYTDNYIPSGIIMGFYTFDKGVWQDHSAKTTAAPVADLVDVTYHPGNQQFYFASFGDGIGVWDGGENVMLIDENTPGSTLVNSRPSERFTRISALDTDG